MPTTQEVQDWAGLELVGNGDQKIGKIDHVYLDRQTGEPTFAAVKTGLFGASSSLVPIGSAHATEDQVSVPYTKDQVKDAPNVDDDRELSETEEQRLYEHYDIAYAGYDGPDHDSMPSRDSSRDDRRDLAGEPGITGQDTSGPTTDDAMTRSEEEVLVGTRQVQTGKARLRKFVVTENVTKTVPVSHEEVRIVHEPIDPSNADAANSGADISEEEHEVTLLAEEPVVDKQVVAKERVRLETDTITDEATVDETLRKEVIEDASDHGTNVSGR